MITGVLLRAVLILILFWAGMYFMKHRKQRLRTLGYFAFGFGCLHTIRLAMSLF